MRKPVCASVRPLKGAVALAGNVYWAGLEDQYFTALVLPNAVVVRTFSKAWGLAAARVGYAIGPAEVIRALRAAGNPLHRVRVRGEGRLKCDGAVV